MAERDEHQQSSGCSACDQLGQTPTPEHLAGVARFDARQQAARNAESLLAENARLRERVAELEAEVSRLRFGGSSLAEVYQCAACSACACQGFDDGLPADWQQNTDGDAFCAACLATSPLDPHECEDETCCAALAGQEQGGAV